MKNRNVILAVGLVVWTSILLVAYLYKSPEVVQSTASAEISPAPGAQKTVQKVEVKTVTFTVRPRLATSTN